MAEDKNTPEQPESKAAQAKDAAGKATANAAVSIAKAIATRNAGEAVKGVGGDALKKGAADAAKKGVTDAAKQGATDAAKKGAGDAVKGAAKDAAKDALTSIGSTSKPSAGSGSTSSQVKDAAKSLATGDAKGAAAKTIQATGPDAENDTVKGTVENTVKGAVGGAAGGALAGGVGAIPGAIVGAASGFLANKRGRNTLIAILAVLIIGPLLSIGTLGFTVLTMASALTGGQQSASVESLRESGLEDDEITEALRLAGTSLAPWQMMKAIEQETGAPTDVQLLNEKMQAVNSNLDGFEMGAGTGYLPGSSFRTIGESESDKAAAEAVKKNWTDVLNEYSKTHKLDVDKTYNQALTWYLGQLMGDCAPAEVPTAVEGGMEFDAGNGKTRKLDDIQMKNAAAIFQEARKIKGVNENAIIIAYMAALTESNLYNYANKNVPDSLNYDHDKVGQDHDSVGFWQMRQHWGTTAQLMSIPYQTAAFFGGPDGPNKGSPRGLFDIKNWETRPKGEAAQAVEVSAFPDRYAANETLATNLAKHLANGSEFGSCSGAVITGEFGSPFGPNPKAGGISSNFGPRNSICGPNGCSSSFHKGLDFGAGCETPLYASAGGTVTRTGINGGWGNVVEITTPEGVMLRYAHQPYGTTWPAVGSTVQTGQLIGQVGMTGVSFGCHLHLEVLVGNVQIDPYTWLKERAVPMYWESSRVDGYIPGDPVL